MQSCLYTVVRNTSGVAQHFGYILNPGSYLPRGVTLAAGEEVAIAGDLTTRLANCRTADRTFKSYENALSTGKLAILNTPDVHIYDNTLDTVKTLWVSNGVVGVTAPCWGTYSGTSDPVTPV